MAGTGLDVCGRDLELTKSKVGVRGARKDGKNLLSKSLEAEGPPCPSFPSSCHQINIVHACINHCSFPLLSSQTLKQQFQLEFSCPVRHSITQEVPLVNTSDQAIVVQATLDGGKAWTGGKDISVPAGGTVNYIITFKPMSSGGNRHIVKPLNLSSDLISNNFD